MQPYVLTLGPTIRRGEILGLCERLAELGRPVRVVVCVRAVTNPDMLTVEALARICLTARRHDCEVSVRGLDERLCQLIILTGLDCVVPLD
ncbi:STAS domain-containing protein [Asanoa sp. WMMD1127]|uniref:STAS domain-containing protein n=1 Tax=Asanoa sp. WMMD1127 TaxID=3016107 RepID=UPI0024159766|nr:STAS domain-containing protein [Asanoa sp. WMMD1127]MDG4821462.1 STAS domain-containing protein [Asanoa sp. WMMD1127]